MVHVETDLSHVGPRKLKRELRDVTGRFRVLSVKREMSIQDFIEQATGKPYIIGSAYYQLTKTEKLPPRRHVLLMVKGTNVIWGGKKAADLVGIPLTRRVVVAPGDHRRMEVFVESRSVNRILVRGTRVLLDMTCKRSKKPTWNHLAV